MKLTATIVGKWIGVAVGAAMAAAAGASAAARGRVGQLDQIIETLARVEGDVRLLKCNAGFPGDCPGQAAPPAPPRAR